jgi:hypothetical protein
MQQRGSEHLQNRRTETLDMRQLLSLLLKLVAHLLFLSLLLLLNQLLLSFLSMAIFPWTICIALFGPV